MSLTYKIIWIDDTKEWVDSIQESVRETLEDEGFAYTSKYYDRCPDLKAVFPDPELSLLAVDWNLPELMGDEVIRQVREIEGYIDVLIYSQDGAAAINGQRLDGVFYRSRSDVPDAVHEILQNHVERTVSLHAMRGIIVAEAIKIENSLAEFMAAFLGGRKQFYLDEIVRGYNTPYSFGFKHVFVARALKELMTEADNAGDVELKNRVKTIGDKLKKLPDDVIDYRNIFAHGDWERTAGGKIVLHGINKRLETVEISRDECRAIRLKYQGHINNLEELAKLLEESTP